MAADRIALVTGAGQAAWQGNRQRASPDKGLRDRAPLQFFRIGGAQELHDEILVEAVAVRCCFKKT